jgi:hypothetical protein
LSRIWASFSSRSALREKSETMLAHSNTDRREDLQEISELGVRDAPRAFRDLVGNRKRGSPQLLGKPVLSKSLDPIRNLKQPHAEIRPTLPNLQILKPEHHHLQARSEEQRGVKLGVALCLTALGSLPLTLGSLLKLRRRRWFPFCGSSRGR